MDFNAILDFGKSNEYVNTVIETARGSSLKIEYRRDGKYFALDRVEPTIFAKPVSYGFVPQTLDEDGDELDTLVICEEPLPMGLVVKAKVIGLLDFEDSDEADHKVVCVPDDERNTGDAINSLDDLSIGLKKQIEHHFNHYKDLKRPGTTKVHGWKNADEAWKVIEACSKAYRQA